MKTITAVFLFVLLTTSCKKSPFSDCTPEKFAYNLLVDKKISVPPGPPSQVSIENGDKLVFNYTHTYRDCKNISDDEGSEILVFEISKTDNSFDVSGAALSTINCYSQASCFCGNINAIAITGGRIKGTKVAENRWMIDANVTNAVTNRQYVFLAAFTTP